MTDQVADIIGAATQQIVQQAQTLGLTWSLQIASVVTSTQTKGVTITLDGDTVAIAATNITGNVLLGGDRVYCIIVPQAGCFVLGYAEPRTRVGIDAELVSAQTLNTGVTTPINWDSAPYDSSGFIAVLPSTSITIPTGMDGLYAVTVFVAMSTSGTNNFLEVTTDGTNFIRSRSTSGQGLFSVSGTKFLTAGTVLTANVLQAGGVNGTMTALGWVYRVG